MALRDTLFQSIAALDRIAPPEEPTSPVYSDEKIPIRESTQPSHLYTWHDDEKFVRLSTSTLRSFPYLRRSRSLASLHDSICLPEVDNSKMEGHGEPKITRRHAAHIARHVLTIVFSFLSIGAAVAIIGLAADNINWGTGRGSQEVNTITVVVLGEYDEERDHIDRWVTKMSYLPSKYDTPTFAGLIVASAMCVLCGVVVSPLSVVYWKSTGRSVTLGSRRLLFQRWTLLTCLALESITFFTTLVELICVRELYTSDRGFNFYDWTDKYSIRPEYFEPPLPATSQWNCRLQAHVSSNTQHRIFQLCEEGNAARWLLVTMVLLQGTVLASHVCVWVEEKRGGARSWTQQRLGSEERVAPSETVG